MTCKGVCRCGETLTLREMVAYGGRCEDCYSTVCLYLYQQPMRHQVKLRTEELAHYRMVRRPRLKKRKARY